MAEATLNYQTIRTTHAAREAVGYSLIKTREHEDILCLFSFSFRMI